jgi:hypothetical protein
MRGAREVLAHSSPLSLEAKLPPRNRQLPSSSSGLHQLVPFGGVAAEIRGTRGRGAAQRLTKDSFRGQNSR